MTTEYTMNEATRKKLSGFLPMRNDATVKFNLGEILGNSKKDDDEDVIYPEFEFKVFPKSAENTYRILFDKMINASNEKKRIEEETKILEHIEEFYVGVENLGYGNSDDEFDGGFKDLPTILKVTVAKIISLKLGISTDV